MSFLDDWLFLSDKIKANDFDKLDLKNIPEDKIESTLAENGYSYIEGTNKKFLTKKSYAPVVGIGATAGGVATAETLAEITAFEEVAEGVYDISILSKGAVIGTEVGAATDTVAAVAGVTPPQVIAAVAAGIGLTIATADVTNYLYTKYFGYDDFDWSTDSIGSKIIAFVAGDKTYVSTDLANRIKDRLIEIGAFNEGVFIPDSLVIQSYQAPLTYYNFNLSNAITLPNPNGADIEEQNLYIMLERLLTEANINILEPNTLTVIYGYNSNSTYYGCDMRIEQYLIPENIKIGCLTATNTLFNKDIKDFNGYYVSELKTSTLAGFVFDKPITRTISAQLQGVVSNKKFLSTPYVNVNRTPVVITTNKNNWASFGFWGLNGYFAYNIGNVSSSGIPNVTKQPNVTYPTKNEPLPTTYPNWYKNAGKVKTSDDEDLDVMPITFPTPDKVIDTQDEAQTGTYPIPSPDVKPAIETMIEEVITPDITPDVPTKDDGDTPNPPIPPTGVQATGFVALYNPTQSQLSAFSQYLWSNDFIDNFKKLFANPMDAIIGLHIIYATPSRGVDAEIVCGYAHSGVNSKTVNSQYIEIDCGSIKVNRYFGNVLDYNPYTHIQVYLPFVGIVDLDTNEIMGGVLNIKYRIDVLTGSCLARLKVTRGDYKAELYNFAGNCAVQLPISGGSYSGIIANAIGVAGSIGATIASGGALAPVLVGSAVSSAVNSHVNVSHSGSLGSNAGALGIMKPYLIITRPKPAEADNFNKFYGKPSNKTVKLSSCSGYTRVKDVHVDNIVATDNELSEIEQLLKEGVII